MAFYVAVGPRGLLFRAGLIWTDVTGSLTYWWASRRRSGALPATEAHANSPDSPDEPRESPR